MGSKEAYEADKAARKAARDALIEKAQKDEQSVTDLMKSGFDLADRLVTALERIADGLTK
jgi:hypothetical protein